MERAGTVEGDRERTKPFAGVAIWLGQQRLRISAADKQTKVYWGALAAALLLGVFLRENGFLNRQPSFWLDEALWAPRFMVWTWEKLGIRPIGFVWLTRQLVEHFEPSEYWFRFLPNLSGLLALGLMPYVASRLLESRALRVALVLLFAIHPGLVDLSKEFKPYSFEVLVHLLTVVLYLRYEQTRKAGYLYALLAYLPVAFLLAYNTAFALPSLLLLVAWSGLKRRSLPLILASVLGAALCAGVVYKVNTDYLQKVEKQNHGKTEDYWGRKYDVFFSAERDGSRAKWTLGKAGETLALAGLERELWLDDPRLPEGLVNKLGTIDRALWIVLGVLGAVLLLRKRREQALLLLLPLVVLAGVNALGKWPLGQFRTNLFLCAYLLPLPILGIEFLRGLLGQRAERALLVLVAVDALGGFLFTFDPQGHKRVWCQDGYSREIVEALFDLRKEEEKQDPRARPARLVLDLFAHKPLDYYMEVHPRVSPRRREFYRDFKVDKVASNRLTAIANYRLHGAGLVYVVASKRTSAAELRRWVAAHPSAVVRQRDISGNVLIVVLDG